VGDSINLKIIGGVCLIGYTAMQSIESGLPFQRNTLPPFSGLKSRLSKNLCES
jgi:hypothetical protein